jgi:hypothetical protein
MFFYRRLRSLIGEVVGVAVDIGEEGTITQEADAHVSPSCVSRHPYEGFWGDVVGGSADQVVYARQGAVGCSGPLAAAFDRGDARVAVGFEGGSGLCDE